MSPGLLAVLLVAGLLAMIPVWRLHVAGWSSRSLFAAWVLYSAGIIAAVRFPAPVRFLLPVLVLAYLAPFVAGPERLSRVLGRRRAKRPVIDVTPRPAPELPEPELDPDDGGEDADGAADEAGTSPGGPLR